MCKYATLDIIKVTTNEQLKIIQEVLDSKPTDSQTEMLQPSKFNPALWESDDKND